MVSYTVDESVHELFSCSGSGVVHLLLTPRLEGFKSVLYSPIVVFVSSSYVIVRLGKGLMSIFMPGGHTKSPGLGGHLMDFVACQ